MALERIAAILQGVTSNFDTDVLHGPIEIGERLSGRTYGQNEADDQALRIMADHARSVTFMIADGILPGNEGRGLSRLRQPAACRAVMKGHLLGIDGPFLGAYVDNIIEVMGSVYPEIVENRELVHRIVLNEEERFGKTLRQGRTYLADALDKLEGTTLSGQAAFVLHDTYGFPVEVTQEICADAGISVDMEGFAQCMEEQRTRARANAKDADAAWSTYDGSMSALLERVGATRFVGYDANEAPATVKALLRDGAPVSTLAAGESGLLVADQTPFYAEMGGQVGDTGLMIGDAATVRVTDTKSLEKGLTVHSVKVEDGTVSVGDTLQARIDVLRRERIRRNHTATHILHFRAAHQLGDSRSRPVSLVAPDRRGASTSPLRC